MNEFLKLDNKKIIKILIEIKNNLKKIRLKLSTDQN